MLVNWVKMMGAFVAVLAIFFLGVLLFRKYAEISCNHEEVRACSNPGDQGAELAQHTLCSGMPGGPFSGRLGTTRHPQPTPYSRIHGSV